MVGGRGKLQFVIRRSLAKCLKSDTPQSAAEVLVLLKNIGLVEEKYISYLANMLLASSMPGPLVGLAHHTYAGLVSRH